jgi:hypothetical protein
MTGIGLDDTGLREKVGDAGAEGSGETARELGRVIGVLSGTEGASAQPNSDVRIAASDGSVRDGIGGEELDSWVGVRALASSAIDEAGREERVLQRVCVCVDV